jgi:DNA recombination protein RmuC
MNLTNFLLIVSIAGLALVIYFLYSQNKSKEREDQNQPLSQLNQNLQGMETRVNSKLEQVQSSYSKLNKEIGIVQNLSQQMKDLNSMIKSPKLRGNIGEKLMEKLLSDMLPKKSYQTQYQFKNGIVDAVIKIQDELIPIDSKFPIENFKKYQEAEDKQEKENYKKQFVRDVRKHIRDISEKYIRTEEGTVNFAVMYVPSEMIYQAISQNEELWSYSNQHRVFMTSPNHFYYFLQTILIGIERYRISKASKQILDNLKAIQRDVSQFSETLGIVDKHLSNAKKQMNTAKNNFSEIKDSIDNTAKVEEEAVSPKDETEEEIEISQIKE